MIIQQNTIEALIVKFQLFYSTKLRNFKPLNRWRYDNLYLF